MSAPDALAARLTAMWRELTAVGSTTTVGHIVAAGDQLAAELDRLAAVERGNNAPKGGNGGESVTTLRQLLADRTAELDREMQACHTMTLRCHAAEAIAEAARAWGDAEIAFKNAPSLKAMLDLDDAENALRAALVTAVRPTA